MDVLFDSQYRSVSEACSGLWRLHTPFTIRAPMRVTKPLRLSLLSEESTRVEPDSFGARSSAHSSRPALRDASVSCKDERSHPSSRAYDLADVSASGQRSKRISELLPKTPPPLSAAPQARSEATPRTTCSRLRQGEGSCVRFRLHESITWASRGTRDIEDHLTFRCFQSWHVTRALGGSRERRCRAKAQLPAPFRFWAARCPGLPAGYVTGPLQDDIGIHCRHFRALRTFALFPPSSFVLIAVPPSVLF